MCAHMVEIHWKHIFLICFVFSFIFRKYFGYRGKKMGYDKSDGLSHEIPSWIWQSKRKDQPLM
jgi:hypothetical protein